MRNETAVSIILPCFNQVRFTRRAISSILAYTTHPFEIIIIDNGSTDGTARYLRGLRPTVSRRNAFLKRFLVIPNRVNRGVSAALNQGISRAEGAFFCYLNNDVIVTRGWLEGLVRCAKSDRRIGLVGCGTCPVISDDSLFPRTPGYRSENEIQLMAAAMGLARRGVYHEVRFVHGFCLFFRRDVFERIGPFDERFFPCGGDDLDYAMRARAAGYRLVNALDVFVFHFRSRATGSAKFRKGYRDIETVTAETKRKFIEKWGKEGAAFYRALGRSMRERAGKRRLPSLSRCRRNA